jgi:hypothetical protein
MGYGLNGKGIRVCFLPEVRQFCLIQCPDGLRALTGLLSNPYWRLISGGKANWAWSWLSTTLRAKVKNMWIYTSDLPIHLQSVMLKECRDKFTFMSLTVKWIKFHSSFSWARPGSHPEWKSIFGLCPRPWAPGVKVTQRLCSYCVAPP